MKYAGVRCVGLPPSTTSPHAMQRGQDMQRFNFRPIAGGAEVRANNPASVHWRDRNRAR